MLAIEIIHNLDHFEELSKKERNSFIKKMIKYKNKKTFAAHARIMHKLENVTKKYPQYFV